MALRREDGLLFSNRSKIGEREAPNLSARAAGHCWHPLLMYSDKGAFPPFLHGAAVAPEQPCALEPGRRHCPKLPGSGGGFPGPQHRTRL